MSKFGILASAFALAVGTAACGNSQGQSNSLVDVGPSAVMSVSEDGDTGTFATLAKGGRNTGGGGTTGGSGGTISLVLLNSTDGLAHFNGLATFNVSTSATSQPWVTVKCYRGSLVYQESNGIFATSLDRIFTFGPTPDWPGGDADCTATLENWSSYPKSITVLASMSFHVYP